MDRLVSPEEIAKQYVAVWKEKIAVPISNELWRKYVEYIQFLANLANKRKLRISTSIIDIPPFVLHRIVYAINKFHQTYRDKIICIDLCYSNQLNSLVLYPVLSSGHAEPIVIPVKKVLTIYTHKWRNVKIASVKVYFFDIENLEYVPVELFKVRTPTGNEELYLRLGFGPFTRTLKLSDFRTERELAEAQLLIKMFENILEKNMDKSSTASRDRLLHVLVSRSRLRRVLAYLLRKRQRTFTVEELHTAGICNALSSCYYLVNELQDLGLVTKCGKLGRHTLYGLLIDLDEVCSVLREALDISRKIKKREDPELRELAQLCSEN